MHPSEFFKLEDTTDCSVGRSVTYPLHQAKEVKDLSHKKEYITYNSHFYTDVQMLYHVCIHIFGVQDSKIDCLFNNGGWRW